MTHSPEHGVVATPAPSDRSRGIILVGEIVAASTPAAEILYGRDVKFYEALRSLPIGTQLYAASEDSADA